jgi:hypothetical protein
MNRSMRLLPCLAFLMPVACSADDPSPGGETVGNMALEISVPDDGTAACLEAVVRNVKNGRERVLVVALNPGEEQTIDFGWVPAGDVEITAFMTPEFDEAGCAGTQSYAADPLRLRIAPGETVHTSLSFRARGNVILDGDIDGPDDIYETPPVECPAEFELVPRELLALEPGGPGGSGLLGTYSDGTVMVGEGPIWFGPHEAGWVPSYYPADRLADETAPPLWQTISGIGGEVLTGYFQSPITGAVELLVSCDDYCSIDIPGVISVVEDNTDFVVSGVVELVAGTWYPLEIGYANRWGTNWLYFSYRCPVPA